jgi:hypothetical protein
VPQPAKLNGKRQACKAATDNGNIIWFYIIHCNK